ncbi:hypothetical protein AKJ09_07545 [Labilithrix luteola]|uniref:Uncharacterized protein n=1 Tax=Labilithrix luteola TaxID=1391654 RepID=A0A0K1Q5F2_9BACT|nr:hypothetical protein AKJ09_07545 [Labilithrix luteola]
MSPSLSAPAERERGTTRARAPFRDARLDARAMLRARRRLVQARPTSVTREPTSRHKSTGLQPNS